MFCVREHKRGATRRGRAHGRTPPLVSPSHHRHTGEPNARHGVSESWAAECLRDVDGHGPLPCRRDLSGRGGCSAGTPRSAVHEASARDYPGLEVTILRGVSRVSGRVGAQSTPAHRPRRRRFASAAQRHDRRTASSHPSSATRTHRQPNRREDSQHRDRHATHRGRLVSRIRPTSERTRNRSPRVGCGSTAARMDRLVRRADPRRTCLRW
jgi:hypothetical protein